MGFTEATPIQEATIPTVLAGRDLIGQAQTGTGKTGAFGIPLINLIDLEDDSVQGLVLAPTRELAIQVADALKAMGRYKGVKTVAIYGGADMRRQIRELKGNPHIIVATPGRLMDHMRRKTARLQQVKMVVLDEADEMLNMGFVEDIETILKEVPTERQTVLFSATMPSKVEKLAKTFMSEPDRITIKAKEVTMENIEQFYVEVGERDKFDTLCLLIEVDKPELAIVFGRTKRRVDELSEALAKRGIRAEGIHGDLTQAKRDSVLRKFKNGAVDVLVATDVAARGLDISGVTHVYNFDLPQDPESYVHRIGRTGRAGKSGQAVTFVTSRERDHLRAIEQVTKKKMARRAKPTLEEALVHQQEEVVEQIRQTLASGDTDAYRKLAKDLLQETDALSALAAALKLLIKEPDLTPVKLTAEAPLRVKKQRTQGGGTRKSGSSSGRPYRSQRKNDYDRPMRFAKKQQDKKRRAK